MAQLSPSDVQYQFEHLHESKVQTLLVSMIICYVLAVTAVILRLVSRRLNKAPIQSDDWVILLALALTTGFSIAGFLGIHNGFGRHGIVIKHPVVYSKLFLAISIFYLVGIAAIKVSILLLYRRIFGVSQRFKIVSSALGIFILAYTIAGLLAVVFQCQPVQGLWDTTIKANCIDFNVPAIILASFNVVTDFLTLALPMPLIWNLRMSTGRKVQITGIFLLGGLVCICSTYRATLVHQMSRSESSWSDVDIAIWAMVEMGIGIVSACLPTLRPVLHWITRGGADERRASDKHLQRSSSGNKLKRGPVSWLFPSSLQFSQAGTDETNRKESNEADESA